MKYITIIAGHPVSMHRKPARTPIILRAVEIASYSAKLTVTMAICWILIVALLSFG
ncbi:MAG: hypothetical protein IPN69_08595 [Acidobacteria bacterium]|nr:hypothetical protein [Acidobacteriota bacterium]